MKQLLGYSQNKMKLQIDDLNKQVDAMIDGCACLGAAVKAHNLYAVSFWIDELENQLAGLKQMFDMLDKPAVHKSRENVLGMLGVLKKLVYVFFFALYLLVLMLIHLPSTIHDNDDD